MYRSITLLLILALTLAACVRSMAAYSVELPPAFPTENTSLSLPTWEAATDLPVDPTLTPALSEAEVEPTAEQTPSLSLTSAATATPFPTDQPFVPEYTIQSGTPITATNFLHPEEGCNWAGLSGQVFGGDGLPVTGLVIEVRGEVDDQAVQALGMTGAVANLGIGGYEVKIQGSPVQGGGELQAQVFEDGQPLSEPVPFYLSPGCENNLMLLNFVATGSIPQAGFLYFPTVLNGKAETP